MLKKLSWIAGWMCVAAGVFAAQAGPVADLAELKAATAKAAPGDVIIMADGTWKDADILFEAKGTPEAPVTLRAQTPGKVILTGGSRLRFGGEWLVVDGLKFTEGTPGNKAVIEFRKDSKKLAANCRLTNCAIINYNPPDPATDYDWVSIYGTRNRVDHCWFSGMNHKGVLLVVWPAPDGPPNETQIDHNYFGDRPRGPDNGYETMRIGTSDVSMTVSRAAVESNYFTHCDGEMEIISNKSCENVYRGNTFVDNKGQLCLRHGQRCRVEGNFFLGYGVSNASGVRVIDAGHTLVNNYFGGLKGTKERGAVVLANGVPNSRPEEYLQVKGALVAFNTFVDCRENFVIGAAGGKKATLPPEDCRIAGNVVVGKTAPLFKILTPPTGMKYEGNIVSGAETGLPETPGIKVADRNFRFIEGADKIWRVEDPPDATVGPEGAPGKWKLLKPEDVGPGWMREHSS